MTAPALASLARGACPDGPALARVVDGEVDERARRSLDEHLVGCARCRQNLADLRATADLLSADPAAGALPDLAPLVLARAELPPPRRRLLPALTYGLGLAAALCAGVLVEQRLGARPDDGFVARGGGDNPDRWVAIHPYRAYPPAGAAPQRLADGAAIGAEPLLLSYDNGGPTPYRYLMVLGVDAAGQALWFFPDETPGATSVPIEAGSGRELRDEVCFRPAAGALRLYGVFSQAPLTVAEVGRAAARAGAGERLALPGTGQHLVTLSVGPAAAGARTCGDRGPR